MTIEQEPPPLRVNVVKNSAWLGAAQLVGWLTTPIVLLFVARSLGAASVGSLVLALTVWAVAGVAIDLGLEAEVTRSSATRPSEMPELVRAARTLVWTMFAGAFVIVLSGQWLVFGGHDFTALFAVVGAQTLFERMSAVVSGALRGLERVQPVALADGSAKLANLLLTLGVLAFTKELWVIAGAGALATAVRLGLLGRFLRSASADLPAVAPPKRTWGSLRTLTKAASGVLAVNVVMVVYNQVDVLMMSLLVESDALGWYSVAERFSMTSLFGATVIVGAVFPSLARLGSSSDEGMQLIRRTVRLLVVIGTAVGLGMAVVGQRLAPFVFGTDFEEAGGVLVFFALALLATYLLVAIGGVALATNRERIWIRMQLAGLVATIVLNVILIPIADERYGNGALAGAWTTLAIEYSMLPVGVMLIVPSLFDRQTTIAALRALVAGAVMVGVVLLVAALPLAAMISIGGVTYVATLQLMGGMPWEDLRALRG